jgi:hypothetical protein
LEFYAVNKNYPEEIFDEHCGRKLDADLYIDDRNLGGFPGWDVVWQMLNPENPYLYADAQEKKGSVFQILKKLFHNQRKS